VAGPGPAPPRLPLAFAPWLCLRPEYQSLLPGAGGLSFYLEDAGGQRSIAQLHLPADAAGLLQLAPAVTVSQLQFFFAGIEGELRRRGQSVLALQGQPFIYDAASAATLAETLRQRRYRVVLAEQNYHLDLSRPYEPHLHPAALRRLYASRHHGLHVEQEPPYLLPLAYEFVLACARERGLPVPFTLEQVQELFRRFPRETFLFSVRQPDGQWAALTLLLRVSDDILYSFDPISPLRLAPLSPAVLLYEGLHAFGQASGLRVLDLGTTMADLGLNVALRRFKQRVVGVAGLRLSWEHQL
jgi:hypothetical protein